MVSLFLSTQHTHLCSKGKKVNGYMFSYSDSESIFLHVDVHEVLGPLCSILGEDDESDCNTALDSVI